MPTHTPASGRTGRSVAHLHNGFIEAIDDELQAIEARGHSDAISVGPGTLIRKDAGSWWYRFQLSARASALQPGREVGFQTPSCVVPAHVISRRDGVAVLSVEEDLGLHTAAGRLLVDSRWILTALRRRVTSIDDAARTGRFSRLAARRSLGEGNLATGGSPVPRVLPLPGALNRQQRSVIEEAHRRMILFTWGPAGTGKTSTLHSTILSLLATGMRILFVAPTNLAADAILERGTDQLRARVEAVDGAVLRLGPLEAVTLSAELRDEFCLHPAVLRRLGDARASDRDAYRREAGRLVHNAKMVVTTVHQTFLSPLITDTRWDVVIVDEASMIPPVSLYVATGLGDRAIIAGDFRQLPPVVLSRSAAANTWLRRDAFDVVGIPDDVERGDYPPYLVMLTQQYRMAPGICELVSDAYDGQLTTDPDVIHRPSGPLGPHDVLFVDSGQHGARVEVLRSGSRQNATNVAMTESLLERMLERRVLGRDDLCRVMVITPFVAQAELYYETLRKRFGRAAPAIRTIHRSQGREADIVLLDLVDARNEDVSRFLRASSYRSEGGRLLTVGVTRARQHLIVIADFEHLLTAPDTGSVARHILQRVVATGKQIRPRQAAAR